MKPEKHLIALIGFGTVAKGLIQILHDKRPYLLNDYDFDFEIVAVSTRSRGTMYKADGLSLSGLLNESKVKTPFSNHLEDWDAAEMIVRSNATVVVELAHTDLKTAEPALTYCKTALQGGKHLICGNKGPAALAYDDLALLAEEQERFFLNEATVLSGTPVFSLMENTLAGNKLLGLRGILNGATNYLLSEMETGIPYEDALKKAEDLGYLEADRSADIEGIDAQAKLAILANILTETTLPLDVIKCSGIDTLNTEDIQRAQKENKRWKLVASLDVGDDFVHAEVKPEKLDMNDPLAHIMGTTNSICFNTDLLGDVTITGPGAGSVETGFSILSDLLTINAEVRS